MLIVPIVVYFLLILFVIPIEHLAFGRHPKWKPREMARRAIGIGTVMALALIPVILGGLDWLTWLMLLAGFLLAGGIMAVMTWRENGQLRKVRRAVDEYISRWEKEAD